MKIKIEAYIPGGNRPESTDTLIDSVRSLDEGKSYADMIRFRVSGKAANQCNDTYYICTDAEGDFCSRLWMGWGRHEGAVGNWGNFFTEEALRGQGIGRQMMDFWKSDLASRPDAPLALFCTANERNTEWYSAYGWRPALKGASCGPLYCPLGDSPETFEEFRDGYYKPANALVFKPATLEWRHEIDCLFKFAMLTLNQDYLPEGIESLEKALLDNDTSVELIFTDTGIPVGLSRTKADGQRDIRVYPSYLHLI